jgi:hypothetical protein
MTLSVDLWELITAIGTGLTVLSSVALTILKVLLKSLEARLESRFKTLEDSSNKQSEEWQRVERELMKMQADLPLNYVRREDYIRNQSVIEAKLDGLAIRIENALLKGDRNG